jgi:hypothetical protein
MKSKIIEIQDSENYSSDPLKQAGLHFTKNARFEKYFLSHKAEMETIEELINTNPENMTYKKLMVMSIFSSLEMISSGVIKYVKPYIIPLLLNRLSDSEETEELPENHHIDYSILFTFCAADEKTYRIDDSGLIKIEKLKLPLRDKLMFSVQLLFKIRNQELSSKLMDRWVDFLKAIRIRDRITHPKKLTDMHISEHDYNHVLKTHRWIRKYILFDNPE